MQSVIIEEPYNFHQPHLPRECYRVSKGQDGARSCVSWGQAMAWETSALSVYLFRALGLRQVLALCRALWIHALLDTLCTGPFQVALVVKSLPAKAGDIRDAGLIPGSGRPPGGGNGNPLQYFAWRIQWTEEPGGLQSVESQRVGHDWASFTYIEQIMAGLFFETSICVSVCPCSHYEVVAGLLLFIL